GETIRIISARAASRKERAAYASREDLLLGRPGADRRAAGSRAASRQASGRAFGARADRHPSRPRRPARPARGGDSRRHRLSDAHPSAARRTRPAKRLTIRSTSSTPATSRNERSNDVDRGDDEADEEQATSRGALMPSRSTVTSRPPAF